MPRVKNISLHGWRGKLFNCNNTVRVKVAQDLAKLLTLLYGESKP